MKAHISVLAAVFFGGAALIPISKAEAADPFYVDVVMAADACMSAFGSGDVTGAPDVGGLSFNPAGCTVDAASLTVGFSGSVIFDGPGDDLRIVLTNEADVESGDVYVSADGVTFDFLGSITPPIGTPDYETVDFDISGTADFVKYVRIVHTGVSGDGLDIDTVAGLNVESEKIYAVDTQTNSGGDGSLLFEVTLAEGPAVANYKLLEIDECYIDGPPVDTMAEQDCVDDDAVPFDRVEGLAGTPDGARLYLIDRDTAEIGYYEFATKTFVKVGVVQEPGPSDVITLIELAFGPDGTLYGVQGSDNELYCINPLTGAATLVGVVTDNQGIAPSNLPVDINGGDLAITATGDGYIWTNGNGGGFAPRGLYAVDLTCTPGTVNAESLGPVDAVGFVFNGLAIRLNGLGGIVGSEKPDDTVYPIDDTDGTVDVAGGFLVTGDVPGNDLQNGDLSNGVRALCQARSKGYYKTHIDSTPKKDIDTAGVTICNGTSNQVTLDESTIEDILSDAKGKNFSMLAAQTITAILNCDLINDGVWNDDCDRSGYPSIAAAENFLCSAITNTSTGDWWNQEFADAQEQSDANAHAGIMDAFNNQGHGGFCSLFSNDDEGGNGPPS